MLQHASTVGNEQPTKVLHCLGVRTDALREREFWSSIGANPPLYGADNPVSFFDRDLSWGWNLHDLQDLLQLCEVPSVPGVTTPMTYFGMWKVRACPAPWNLLVLV